MLDKIMTRLYQNRIADLAAIGQALRSPERGPSVELRIVDSHGNPKVSVELTDLPYTSFPRELGDFICAKAEVELVSVLKQNHLWRDEE